MELAGCIPSTIQDQEVMCATAQITPSILLSLASLSTVKIGFPMSGNTFQTIPPRHLAHHLHHPPQMHLVACPMACLDMISSTTLITTLHLVLLVCIYLLWRQGFSLVVLKLTRLILKSQQYSSINLLSTGLIGVIPCLSSL